MLLVMVVSQRTILANTNMIIGLTTRLANPISLCLNVMIRYTIEVQIVGSMRSRTNLQNDTQSHEHPKVVSQQH
jgi:hypothetical protein